MKNKKGFTLIELLVVVAIIGLLSSVVMASLNSARGKAKEAAAKQGVLEFKKLFEMQYSETGSYGNLTTFFLPFNSSNCDSSFVGNYAVQARKVCNSILSNLKPIWTTNPDSPGYALLISTQLATKNYSIMMVLNNGNWFCAGSGGTSNNVSYWVSTVDGSNVTVNPPSKYLEAPIGCVYNP